MGESGAATQADVLDREQKFPERKHFRVLAPGGQEDVNGKDEEVGRQDAQGAPGEKTPEIGALAPRQRCQQLPADQVTAEDEEKIDPDPAETVDLVGERKSHDAGVVDDDNDDGERAEQIETGLTLAIRKRGSISSPRGTAFSIAGLGMPVRIRRLNTRESSDIESLTDFQFGAHRGQVTSDGDIPVSV